MKSRLYACIFLGVLLLLPGCNRGSQTPEAVRQGIIDHLAARSDLDLNSIQVDVGAVSFREDEADATVTFRPRGAGPEAAMSMHYTLERKGNRWVVKGKPDSGGHGMSAEPGGPDLPPGHPPMTPPAPGGATGSMGSGTSSGDTGNKK